MTTLAPMPGVEPLWMTALEKQLEAVTTIRRIMSLASPEAKRVVHEHGFTVDNQLLGNAAPFAWSRETSRAVLAAAESVPPDTFFNMWNINSPAAWWFFEEPLPVQTLELEGLQSNGVRALCFGWIFIDDNTRVLGCSAWCDVPKTKALPYSIRPSQTWVWQEGASLGDTLARVRAEHEELYGSTGKWRHKPQVGIDKFMIATDGLSRFVLAGMTWLQQQILVTDVGHVERHRRKDFNRKTGQNITGVRVVNLRRVQRAESTDPTSDDKREYHVRWVVGGHWRNQACGTGHKDRRLTYVHAYLKGPDDAPLQAPRPIVYKVDR